MSTSLPHRPNLDQLRRQAKALLASLREGDAEAARTFAEHLPAARTLGPAQAAGAEWRLADAQSVVARRTGFASWPRLARHVEQLRALEGEWRFEKLEVEGSPVPMSAIAGSRILIDGDRFRTESPGAVYEGVFNIDVEAEPHRLDIEFVEGPEAGNTNRGVFRVEGDTLEICLDMTGAGRPAGFGSTGRGVAYEVLRRASASRPAGVGGGTPGAKAPPAPGADPSEFAFRPGPIFEKLQGDWNAVRIVRDGQELPPFMLKTARRVAKDNRVTISVGGTVVIDALVRIDGAVSPIAVDYLHTAGPGKDAVQHGIMEWRGEEAWFYMSAPGAPRPERFVSTPCAGTTLSGWKRS